VRLLVVGASGYLGGEVAARAAAAGWDVVGTGLRGTGGSRRLDIRDGAAVRALVAALRPDAVVSTASRYEEWAVSADGAANVAAASVAVGARLVHVSSDAVHGGRAEPYLDDEPPTPIFAYGAAKAAAETAVRVLDPAAAIVRTSLIIGDERGKHERLCLDLITGRRPGALFSDEIRCPVAVSDLAAAVLELVGSDFAGRLNVSGPDAVSRPEFGALVARRYGLPGAAIPTSTIAESGLLRPAEVRLDSTLAGRLLGTRLRGAHEILAPA
jgi:dTDP-4-dehydrorhamnose reductase